VRCRRRTPRSCDPRDDRVDATSVSDNPADVIEMTRLYRNADYGVTP
jgi:hypothetical protein